MERIQELEEKVQKILELVSKLKKENEMLASRNSVLQTKLNEQEQVLNDILKENAKLKHEKEETRKTAGDGEAIASRIEEMLKSIDEIEKEEK